jgi:pimeloyl-ACP methyl ester carboxylesterase/quercetin dioxygenase-like cupin family protein
MPQSDLIVTSVRMSAVTRRLARLLPVVLAVGLTSVPHAAQDPAARVSRAVPLPSGFTEKSASVGGVRINYKIGGQGPVVILLHGYTQTSHMWMPLMPRLAMSHTVIAPDLRGAGESERTASGYDKKTMAKDIRDLVRQLGYNQPVQLVGHDIGLMVAYAYAAQYPAEVSKVVLMDAFLPGIGQWQDVWLLRDLWHFHFYGETPEALVKGRERIYFEHFWNDFAADRTKSIPEADRQLYAAAYAQANGVRAGFEYFKVFEQDAKDFAAFSATKLNMPVLVLTGEKASGEFLIAQGRLVATDVRGIVVKGSGHWLMEEAPQEVIPTLVAFLNEPSKRTAAQDRSPAPDPRSPIPDPRSPTPDPRSPIPDPRSPIPDPRSPTPDPRAPIPDPQRLRLTPAEADGLAKSGPGAGTSGVSGIATSVLKGDPTRPGVYTILLKVPANTRIEAHDHPDDRVATVVSGTWYFGYGDRFDEQKLKALPPGSFYTEPPNERHFARTGDADVVVQITGFGPTGTRYADGDSAPRSESRPRHSSAAERQ